MAEPYLADIVGQYQRGQAIGTEQRQAREAEQRQSRLSQLAQMAYGAQGDERRSLIGQAYGESPEFAAGLSKQLGSDDEAQQSMLLSTAKLIKAAPAEYKDAIFQRVRPQLSSQLPGLPLNYNEQVGQGIDAYLVAHGKESNLSDRYRVVGGALVDLQDPTQPVYVAPIATDSGLIEGGPGGFRQVTLGGPPPAPAPAGVGADGIPNVADSGVPPSLVAMDSGARPWTASTPDIVGGGGMGAPILPKGTRDAQERLQLARQAAQNAAEANQRAREASERAAREAEQRQQFGNIPTGFRVNAAGTALEPVPGGPKPAGATATEGERKAATLLKRLEGSLAQLETAVGENPSASSPSVLAETARALPFVGDAAARGLNSSERQRVEAAQLDILDAALTLGTGAAYTREQLEGYRQSYFPQIGDDQSTIDDKAARLNNVIEAAKIAAGRAAPAAGGGMGGGQAAPAPQRARNPQTGQVIELRNGQWVPVDG